MYLARFMLNYLFIKDLAVLIDLLNYKNIHHGVISHCYDDGTALMMQKILNYYKMRISIKSANNSQHFIIPHRYDKIVFVVNTTCEGWINLFDNMYMEDTFKNPFVWVVMTENVIETTEALSRYRMEIDSDVTVISKRDSYNLYEVFYTGFRKNGQLLVRNIGHWNNTLKIETKHRRDLQGLVLKTTVVIPQSQRVVNKTFLRYLDEEKPDLIKPDPMHKFKFYAALKYFQDMFNITYDFQRTNSWGYHSNGTYDGMVGVLQRKESDIGGSPAFLRADRAIAVDYAVEVWQTRPCFIFRHPKHPGGFYTIYTRPLTTRVWYCIISLMVLSMMVLGSLLQLKVIKVPGDDEESWSLTFLLIWSAICQQGMSISRNSTSVKIVIFVTFVFALTLYQYYNATVVSTLLREPPKNIRSLKDLLNSHLKAGVEDILYNKDYYRHTTDPMALEIYNKKIAHSSPFNYFSAEQGLAMVNKGGFAFHIDSATAYKIIRHTFSEKVICELQEVTLYVPRKLGVVVPKRSPYKELVAYGISKMKESGITSRLYSLWDEPRPACVRTPDSSVFSVTLQEFSTALIVLVIGHIAAVAVLIGELVAGRLKRRVIEFRH